METDLYIILTAGGTGQRMQTLLPKQFLDLAGIPVLCRTFMAFKAWFDKAHFIVTLPADHLARWQKLATQHALPAHTLCAGGTTRFQSVKNALEQVPDKAVVLIHDGVRPLVDEETIREAILTTEQYGSAIPYVPITASLRRLNINGTSAAIDRTGVVQVQTPQGFKAKQLKDAYQQPYHTAFTDDATVYETAGHKLYFFEDSDSNIKITTPADLQKATLFLCAK